MIESDEKLKRKQLEDDKVDAVVIVLLIAITVFGVVYWLASMPS